MGNANALNIFAGISGGGTTGGELGWFAPVDTAGPVAVAYTAEVQTVTITGTPAGGTFTLTWNGLSSGPQVYNVATAALATALNTAWASKLGGTTIAVTGTAGTSYVLTFAAALGNVALTSAVHAFTGGTTPTIAVVETTPGAGATPATASLPASFKSAGWCSTDGLNMTPNEASNAIRPYGNFNPVRVIITQSQRDFDLTFLESNQVSVAVYNRQPLGVITADVNGAFTNQVGAAVNTLYSGIFDMVDGTNHIRTYCPRLQVSKIGARSGKAGEAVTYPVTMTAFPDATGNAVYEYYVINALGGTGTG